MDVVVGHPGETEDDFCATLTGVQNLLARAPGLEVNINPFQLVPHSPVWASPDEYAVELIDDHVIIPSELSEFAPLMKAYAKRARWQPQSAGCRGATHQGSPKSSTGQGRWRQSRFWTTNCRAATTIAYFCGVSDLRAAARPARLSNSERH